MIAPMPDMARREALLARSKGLRERTEAFRDRVNDQRAKEWLRTIRLHHLDDVDGFFLGDPKNPALDGDVGDEVGQQRRDDAGACGKVIR
jgi:hypothetical protein